MNPPPQPADHDDFADTDSATRAAWITRIRDGDEAAWRTLIDRYEGRLLAYVNRRLSDRSASEDIVQETLIGFLVSLPNVDPRQNLEGYLFSICSHKLTDHLRRSGRRPTLPLSGRGGGSDAGAIDLPGTARVASSIARSGERQRLEEQVVADAISDQIARWRETDNWVKLKAIELLFVAGRGNQDVALRLRLTEQQVANYKSDFLTRVKVNIARRELDPGVFPELAEDADND